MRPRTALVAGATGLVGRHLIDTLVADAAYDRINALTRRPLHREHAKLTPITADYETLHDERLDATGADAYCALGTTMKTAGSREAFRAVDLGYVTAFATAAHKAGARAFMLVSSLGANAKSGVFYNRVKGAAEAAVRDVGYETVHIFRPSILMGDRDENRPGERAGILFARAIAPALVGPLRRYRGTPARALAEAMVNAAKQTERGVHVHEAEAIPQLAA